MNIGMHIYFQIRVLSTYMPKSGNAGSHGSSIVTFLRNLHTVLHSGCSNLCSHQWHRSIPFSPHPLQHLLLVLCNDGHSGWCEVYAVILGREAIFVVVPAPW